MRANPNCTTNDLVVTRRIPVRLHDVNPTHVQERNALSTRRRGHEETEDLLAPTLHRRLETGGEIAGITPIENLANQLTLLGIITGLRACEEGIRRLLGGHGRILDPLIVLLRDLVLLPAVGVEDCPKDAQAFEFAILRIHELIVPALGRSHRGLDVFQHPEHLGTECLEGFLGEEPLGIRTELVQDDLLVGNRILGRRIFVELAHVGRDGVVAGQTRVHAEGLHLLVICSNRRATLVLLDLLEPNVEVVVELLGRHRNLLEHGFRLNHLRKHPLIGSLEIGDKTLNPALKEKRVLDLESVEEHRCELLVVCREALELFDRHTLNRKFSTPNLRLKRGLPRGDPILGTRDVGHLRLVLNGHPVSLLVVDAAEVGRIPGHKQVLLERVVLHRVEVGDSAQDARHLLLIPCGNGLDRNCNAFNRSAEEVHEEGKLVRTINDGRPGEGDHFAVSCVVDALVELASELRFVDDSGDEVMDLINDDHATRIRVRTVLRDILCDIRRG